MASATLTPTTGVEPEAEETRIAQPSVNRQRISQIAVSNLSLLVPTCCVRVVDESGHASGDGSVFRRAVFISWLPWRLRGGKKCPPMRWTACAVPMIPKS